jgi:hypothetical protein
LCKGKLQLHKKSVSQTVRHRNFYRISQLTEVNEKVNY